MLSLPSASSFHLAGVGTCLCRMKEAWDPGPTQRCPVTTPEVQAGHAGSQCDHEVQCTTVAPEGRARSPCAGPPGKEREKRGAVLGQTGEQCRTDLPPGPWLTTTVLPCSSLTATVPNSTATSWVQATPLRPRSSLVTWTLWGGRTWVLEVRGAGFRRQGVGRRGHT